MAKISSILLIGALLAMSVAALRSESWLTLPLGIVALAMAAVAGFGVGTKVHDCLEDAPAPIDPLAMLIKQNRRNQRKRNFRH